MAALLTPVTTQLSIAWFDALIDAITLASNLSIPTSYEISQTGVISGTTASTIVNALTTQRGLL